MRDTTVNALSICQRWAAFSKWSRRLVLVLTCCLTADDMAWSQAPKPSPTSKNKGKPGAPATPKNPAAPLVIDPDTLPPGFVPPKEVDPRITEVTPLALQDELDKLKKDDAKLLQTLNRAAWDDASKTVIRNSIRYRLAMMCQEKVLQQEKLVDLYNMRVALMRILNGAGSTAKELKPDALRKFRHDVMLEFVKQATPLLQNNLYVREQVVLMMGELEVVQEDTKKNQAVEAFTPAYEPLISVIVDPKQPDSVKLLAINKLTRILKIGTPKVDERTKIAEAMVSELAKSESHWWIQMRLAEGLGSVALDQLKQPIVVTALKNVVADPKREWVVRAEAAKSLGRIPIPAAANPASVVLAISDLAMQMAKVAQQKPGEAHWKSAFWKLYLAFQPLDANEKEATKSGKAGLLNNAVVAGTAKTPYGQIAPMASAVLKGERLTAAQLAGLEAWLKANAPAPGAAQPPEAKPAAE